MRILYLILSSIFLSTAFACSSHDHKKTSKDSTGSPAAAASTTDSKPSTKQLKKCSIKFLSTPILVGFTSARICGADSKNIKKINLFMPEMHHGSSIPTITKDESSPDCLKINNMDFFMEGHWNVRIFYKNGSKCIVSVDVKK